ncbi:MAG: alpha/beta fold hydrolase [Coleofasciculus sp. C1-SOL-03]|uniref:thioesterase II family protein n=1 Tax=Coleofasciculus sp. C1-SOL-03 TaxID=3069522 RepID=UPI0033013D3F
MTVKQNVGSWIICPKPKPKARLRLFCFPCAGGTASAYSSWLNRMPPDVDVCIIQLPGRGSRLMERPFTRLPLLVQTLVSVLQPYLMIPFAFFGHSMGALVGFEVARQLRRQNGSGLVHLFACCCPAPQIPISRQPIYRLPDAAFIAELRHRYHAIPQPILENQELLQLFLPSLRADFTMMGTYQYATEKPLDCPISVFGGLQDRAISYDHLEAWRIQTGRYFMLQLFPGDHFFLHHPESPFLSALSEQIRDCFWARC